MFALRSSISVQVSKKIFVIMNKRDVTNKNWGFVSGVRKKIQKLTSGGDAYLALKSTAKIPITRNSSIISTSQVYERGR